MASRPAAGQRTTNRGAKGAHRRSGRAATKQRAGKGAAARPKASRRPPTRAERRRAAKVRRHRVFLAVSVVLAGLVLAAWFPASALVRQQQALAGASTELQQLQSQNRALAAEQHRLNQSTEIERLARQQYQLVSPGQQAYQVLPPSGSSGAAAGRYPGDPGLQPPVAPSATAELPPSSGAAATTTTPPSAATGKTAADHGSGSRSGPKSPGLIGRIIQSLEFWR
ncbi:MAG TPA: septum formation initiator family protein [Acidimicrobiales bacterium]|nr:septum formation initiator family protein [Acidimicrobiales bacterium]